MATRTWTNAAGGSWTTPANWSAAGVPTAADDVVFSAAGSYTVSLPRASYVLNSLTVGTSSALLALGGSTVTVGALNFTMGTIQGGTIAAAPGGLLAAGGQGDLGLRNPVLDGDTISGVLHVGTTTTSGALTVRNGLVGLNPDGSAATLELASTSNTVASPGYSTMIYFDGTQTWSHLNILMDGGTTDVIQGRTLGPALTLAADTTFTVNGSGSVASVNLGGRIVVGAGGLLVINDGLQAAPSTFLPTARISIASGGLLRVGKNMTSAALTALASQVDGPPGTITANPAFNGYNSAVVPNGSAVDYSGVVTNTGAVLDLTAGGPLAHISRISGSTLAGGTLYNSGAAVAMPFGTLTGVTLQGQFSMDPNVGVLIVHDSLKVVSLDGSDGVLDLATVPTSLRIDAPTTAAANTVIDHVSILMGGNIWGLAPLLLGSSSHVSETGFHSFQGTVTNAGTITITDGVVGASQLRVADYDQSANAGTFVNNGVINIGAGAGLLAVNTFTNNGLVNIGAGATVSATAGATGSYAFKGGSARLSFAAGAEDVVGVTGYRQGDTIAIGTAAAGASLSVASSVVTVSKSGLALAVLNLSDSGASYDAGSLQLGAATDGTIAITTTHGAAPVVTAPTTPTTPVVVTPTTPQIVSPTAPATPVVTTPATPSTPVDTRPQIAFSNATQNTGGTVHADAVAVGAPSYLQWQYIDAGTDSIAYSTQTPNVFIHSGSGNDAIQVASGQNVLDGGLGSNFLTGGTGTDTFFTDARNPGVVWNTIRNFHAGDAATLWGFAAGVSSYRWDTSVAGAAGSQGATLRANIVGGNGRSGDGIDASITFTGLSVDQAKGLQLVTGTQAAGNYLYIYNPGV